MNRFSNGIDIISKDKLPNLLKINNKMLLIKDNFRPNCVEILETKDEWYLNPSDPSIKHFIDQSLAINSLEKSFLHNFIQRKFKNTSKFL